MGLFDLIANELQEVATLQTKAYNKLIDIRVKLTENGWNRVIVWDSEWYISPQFYNYLDINNLSVYNESQFCDPDLSPADKWYGHILYIREED